MQLFIVCLDGVQIDENYGGEVANNKNHPANNKQHPAVAVNDQVVEEPSKDGVDDIDEMFAEYGHHDDIGDAVSFRWSSMFKKNFTCFWFWFFTLSRLDLSLTSWD